MLSAVSSLLASLSLALKQPLAGYCDVETTHGDALVTKQGDYCTFIRIGGMKRMATRDDITRLANALRLDLSGALESKGHAIVGWYLSDPDMAAREIERINMDSCRRVGREVGLDLSDILDERLRLWSETMRWETSCFILWTRRAVLTKEELKQMKEEKAAAAKEVPRIGDAQRFFLRSELMAAHHTGFVNRVMAAMRGAEVAATELSAREALVLSREALYRETAGSQWKPTLIGDKVMPRLPEDDVKHPSKEGLLWPSLRSQIFRIDAVTHGGQRVEIGENEYASVDMMIGPEDPRPFVELASWLGQDRLPWRCSFILEGGGKTGMAFKEIGSSFLSIFPANRDLQRAFASLRNLREQENHISVKLRASFATWAPLGETRKLRRRASTLAQRIEGWGNCKTARVAGDPLDGVMSSVPGPRARLDRQSLARPDRRGDAAPAVVAHDLALGAGIGAVPPAERRDLALRSMRRLDAAAGDRHFRGPAGLRQVGARQHHQYRPLPVVGRPWRRQGETADDRQARHRLVGGRVRAPHSGGGRAGAPA